GTRTRRRRSSRRGYWTPCRRGSSSTTVWPTSWCLTSRVPTFGTPPSRLRDVSSRPCGSALSSWPSSGGGR
ncbi:hypothetical protein HKX48_000868, partial [Thoreauomyces humboldtii]